MLPGEYHKTFEEFMRRINPLINEIELLALTGSGGRGKIVEGWSDLDVLIVMKKTNKKDALFIYDAVKNLPIKVGIELYSKEEFESGLVDSKTIWNIQIIRENKITPILLNNKLNFPEFSRDYLINLHRSLIPERIHKIKRNLARYPEFDTKLLAKDIDTIMKFAMLSMTGAIISGYKEVQESFYKLFPDCPKLYDVFDLIKKEDRENYYCQCWDFLNYFKKKGIINQYKYPEIFSKWK